MLKRLLKADVRLLHQRGFELDVDEALPRVVINHRSGRSWTLPEDTAKAVIQQARNFRLNTLGLELDHCYLAAAKPCIDQHCQLN